MARWTPDPSFYPSPASAAGAPPETLAYVAILNTDSGPDAIGVLDLESGSDSYGQVVGRFEMPNQGDELHHFGWNACSSALCPWAPHTVHCGPDGIYVSALGNPEGDGPGGILLLDHDDFSVKGAWEADRGTQEL